MIAVEQVSFHYAENDASPRIVLNNVSMTIQEGEFIGLIGANGSGKTTLARCLNGLFLPSLGQVRVDGLATHEPDRIIDIRRKVGMVFQNPDNQIVATTVEREIAFGLENLGVPFEKMHTAINEALQNYDLSEYRYHPPHRLSGGERQRLALAAVMAMEPKYLILDEPTSLLDPRSRQDILARIRMLQARARGSDRIGVLLITQYPEETLDCDRLLVMARGQIVRNGLPKEIFAEIDFLKTLNLEPPVEFEIEPMLAPLLGKLTTKDC